MPLDYRAALVAGLLTGAVLVPDRAAAEHEILPPLWWVSGQAHGAFLSDLVDLSSTDLAFGVSLSVGRRWDDFGVFAVLDNPWWSEPELSEDESQVFVAAVQTALGLGLGVEHLYFKNRMHISFSAGVTRLMRRTVVDTPGTMGFFADLRPATIRIPLSDDATLKLAPLTFTLLVPDLAGIPLVLIHYRTALSVEFDL